jgi:hypothetical protein
VSLKLKNVIIEKFALLIFVFGMTMVFSGLWTYGAYTGSGYDVQEKLVSSYTQYGTYTYTAPVTEANPLYAKGTILEMGKPAYFFAVSPTVDVSFTYCLEATDSADVSVERETIIVATSKEVSGEEEKIFWQKEFPLKSEGFDHINNGDSVTQEFSLNVPEIQAMVKGVQDQLKYSQDSTIEIVTRVNYDGKINGENVEGTEEFAIPLVVGSSYYQMPEELKFSEDTDTYKKFRVQKDPSVSIIKIPLSLFLLSTVLVGMILPFMKMNKVEPEYIEKLEKERRRSTFKEFISKGKLPEERDSLMKVEISSLQELIDAAVDMNSRVIYDTEAGTYFMIHNSALYIFFDT